MESAYLFYLYQKIYKSLTNVNWELRGYKIISIDPDTNSLILQKKKYYFKKYFFEVKISPSNKNITLLSVREINTNQPQLDGEKKLINEILRLF